MWKSGWMERLRNFRWKFGWMERLRETLSGNVDGWKGLKWAL